MTTQYVQEMYLRIIEFVDPRPYDPQVTDETCPKCGATMVALRQPSNVRGCPACQNTYHLHLERRIAFMEGVQP